MFSMRTVDPGKELDENPSGDRGLSRRPAGRTPGRLGPAPARRVRINTLDLLAGEGYILEWRPGE